MKITRDNYEIYIIDNLDNNLSDELSAELKLFLDRNPDLKDEADRLSEITLNDTIEYPDKAKLKQIPKIKDFDITEFEYLASAELEGDITVSEKKILATYIESDEKCINELSLYRKTKLEADQNIIFSEKQKLKHDRTLANYRFTYAPVTIAASIIAIFFVLNILIKAPEIVYVNSLAQMSFSNNLKKTQTESENINQTKVLIAHNDTNRFVENTIIEKEDIVTHHTENDTLVYEPLYIPKTNLNISKIQGEVYAMNVENKELIPVKDTYKPVTIENEILKSPVWMIAEKGVGVWKAMTSGELEMENTYTDKGKIEKLSIQTERFGVSQTFYRN